MASVFVFKLESRRQRGLPLTPRPLSRKGRGGKELSARLYQFVLFPIEKLIRIQHNQAQAFECFLLSGRAISASGLFISGDLGTLT